jgi:hypothetical protein
MELWSVQQRIFCVEQFLLSKSMYPCSESFVGNLVMIGNMGLHLQE